MNSHAPTPQTPETIATDVLKTLSETSWTDVQDGIGDDLVTYSKWVRRTAGNAVDQILEIQAPTAALNQTPDAGKSEAQLVGEVIAAVAEILGPQVSGEAAEKLSRIIKYGMQRHTAQAFEHRLGPVLRSVHEPEIDGLNIPITAERRVYNYSCRSEDKIETLQTALDETASRAANLVWQITSYGYFGNETVADLHEHLKGLEAKGQIQPQEHLSEHRPGALRVLPTPSRAADRVLQH